MSGEKDLAHKDVHPQPATGPPLDKKRPYACNYPGCPARFARNDELERHHLLIEHRPASSSGERSFVCDHPGCPSRFTRNDELRRHQRLLGHGPVSSQHGHQAALADDDEVVYNGGHGRRQTGQSAAGRNPSNRDQPSSRPATSMETRSLLEYVRQLSQRSSGGVQPVPRSPGRSPAFMPPPATPTHPPPPPHNRPLTASRLDYSPLRLPLPLANRNGHTMGSGRSRRGWHVQLPESSEVAGQPGHSRS